MGMRKRVKKPPTRDPSKIQKVDNPWVDKLGKKRAKVIRKLVNRINDLSNEEVEIPFNIPVTSIDMIYRGNELSWFHDNNAEDCKLVVRLDGLDEEGIAMHLSETAKCVMFVLWLPLIGDTLTSRQAPDRVWREAEFANPAEFLLSYVNTDKAGILVDLVADRWDAAMMLGGSAQVTTFIKTHIRSDNQKLKDSITQWLGRLKWHQDWDWDDVCETCIWGAFSAPKFDIFWEDESYEIPDSFYATEIWSTQNPYIAHNLRYIVTDVPGFEEIQEALEEEERAIVAWERDHGDSVSNSAGNSAGSSMARSLDGLEEEYSTPVRTWKPITRATSGRRAGFRPDQPYNGANKLAFDTHFEKHGVVVKKIKAPLPRPLPPRPKAPSSGPQKRKAPSISPVEYKKKKVVRRRVTRKARRKTYKKRTAYRYKKRSRSRSGSRYRARKPRYRSKKRKAKRATRRKTTYRKKSHKKKRSYQKKKRSHKKKK